MIYTHFAAAIASAAIAGVVAWHVQDWRHDTQISDLRAKHAKAFADSQQKALTETIALQRIKDEAIKAAQDRARREAIAAASARSERDSLRAQLAAASVQLPTASCPSVREYTAALSGLFDQCAGALTDMAGKAQGHAADTRMILEAWPTNKEP